MVVDVENELEKQKAAVGLKALADTDSIFWLLMDLIRWTLCRDASRVAVVFGAVSPGERVEAAVLRRGEPSALESRQAENARIVP